MADEEPSVVVPIPGSNPDGKAIQFTIKAANLIHIVCTFLALGILYGTMRSENTKMREDIDALKAQGPARVEQLNSMAADLKVALVRIENLQNQVGELNRRVWQEQDRDTVNSRRQ